MKPEREGWRWAIIQGGMKNPDARQHLYRCDDVAGGYGSRVTLCGLRHSAGRPLVTNSGRYLCDVCLRLASAKSVI